MENSKKETSHHSPFVICYLPICHLRTPIHQSSINDREPPHAGPSATGKTRQAHQDFPLGRVAFMIKREDRTFVMTPDEDEPEAGERSRMQSWSLRAVGRQAVGLRTIRPGVFSALRQATQVSQSPRSLVHAAPVGNWRSEISKFGFTIPNPNFPSRIGRPFGDSRGDRNEEIKGRRSGRRGRFDTEPAPRQVIPASRAPARFAPRPGQTESPHDPSPGAAFVVLAPGVHPIR
jgi:hypothetical protein